MNKIRRLIIWICKKFTRDEILNIVDELVKVIDDKYSDIKPKDAFADKHPNYRNFSIDPLSPLDDSEIIKNKPKLNYQYLLSLYEERKGKTLQPIKYRSSSKPVPNSITCPHCSAPHYYIYFNDGKKRSQLKCKVCSNTFQIEKRFVKKTKYYCPYCSKALFTWKENNDYTVYKCSNRKCPHRLAKLNNLNPGEIKLRKQRSSQFKINYQYREYHYLPDELKVAQPHKPTVNLRAIHNDISVVSLILTLHISYAITARKTALMLKNIWNIKISHQTVLNYIGAAAYYCHKFNLKYIGKPDNITSADETYVKLNGRWHYVWLAISSFSKKISAYHFSENRGVKPAIALMLNLFKKANPKEHFSLVTDGNPSYQAGLHFIRSIKPKLKVDNYKVIGLENLDSVSEEYRPYKQIIERLNRTFKYHTHSQNGFGSCNGAISKLVLFVTHYNFLREHYSLKYKTPIVLPELSNIPLIQNKWNKILSMAS